MYIQGSRFKKKTIKHWIWFASFEFSLLVLLLLVPPCSFSFWLLPPLLKQGSCSPSVWAADLWLLNHLCNKTICSKSEWPKAAKGHIQSPFTGTSRSDIMMTWCWAFLWDEKRIAALLRLFASLLYAAQQQPCCRKVGRKRCQVRWVDNNPVGKGGCFTKHHGLEICGFKIEKIRESSQI